MASAPVKFVDLGLPKDKLPTNPDSVDQGEVSSFTTAIGRLWRNPKNHFLTPASEAFSPAVGTTATITQKGDTGLFGSVFEVWANHWNMRTVPEDWWLPLITRVATNIDSNASNAAVRSFFVGEQQGKKDLVVDLPSFSIYDSDYSVLFSAFSTAIERNIHVPGYVDVVSSHFSTSESIHRICSQITLMKSFKTYFNYEMGICGCGINALEMVGTEADWGQLLTKLHALRTLLKPIAHVLGLDEFFLIAEDVFANLHRTFNEDPAMQQWWADVLIQKREEYRYGPSGMKRGEVDMYNGWLVAFLTGNKDRKLRANDLRDGEYAKVLSCLSSCPMKIVDRLRDITDMSAVVGGILGYQIIPGTTPTPTLQAAHGWCLMLPRASRLRACE